MPPVLEAHLDGCLRCREAIVALAGTNEVPFEPGPEPGLWSTVVREADGRYEEVGVCGHGGQSVVFHVRDRHLGRDVALKEFRAHSRSRFAREVHVVGGLSHPAIVPLLEVGLRDNDAPYYTMPLVRGGTLASAVLETEGVARRLRLLPHVVMVCQAVAHAHSRGVLHRDLKPANVMVGEFGETLVIDWGLAKVRGTGSEPARPAEDIQQSESKTMHGAAIGTPAYMSPEQATGDLDNIDERSEVWSLGALLAFILTKKPPFRGNSSNEILIAVASGTKEEVVADDGTVPPELAAVVARAMARGKEDRYPSALALAEDLIAFQSGDGVSAYRYSASERVIRFLSRHRSLLLAGVSVLLSLAVGLALALRSYQNEASARREATDALADAEAAKAAERTQRLAASFNLAAAYVAKAERMRDRHRHLEATRLAAHSLQLDATCSCPHRNRALRSRGPCRPGSSDCIASRAPAACFSCSRCRVLTGATSAPTKAARWSGGSRRAEARRAVHGLQRRRAMDGLGLGRRGHRVVDAGCGARDDVAREPVHRRAPLRRPGVGTRGGGTVWPAPLRGRHVERAPRLHRPSTGAPRGGAERISGCEPGRRSVGQRLGCRDG